MTRRRSISRTMRARIFEAASGICSICGQKIDGVREKWEISHEIPLALGGDDDEGNMRPAHERCHRQHTATVDAPQIAKAKRVHAKHTGAHRPRYVMPGSRASGLKKKLDGTVVRRTE